MGLDQLLASRPHARPNRAPTGRVGRAERGGLTSSGGKDLDWAVGNATTSEPRCKPIADWTWNSLLTCSELIYDLS